MIRGPIRGGSHGWAFGRPLFDLAAHGYVEAEYFLDGEATTYRRDPRTEWGRDGRWTAEAAGRVPFTTRMLVYRPADPERFNHTAIVSWNNVTAGYELFQGESPEILQGGYAFVAASVQRVGVHGFPAANQGLAAWDAERYGALNIPTDDASYDIFTQVARAVGPDRASGGVDPMAGLDVRKVIGIGASQSAGRLATYINAVHPLAHAYDGFLLQIYFGRGTPLEVGPATVNVDMTTPLGGGVDPSALIRRTGLAGANLIRDDLDVPVMVVNSELEAMACHGVRQPDTDRYRCWESAGTSHVSHAVSVVRAAKYPRDFGEVLPVLEHMNRIAITPLYDAAIHHLNRWVGGGAPPPSQPLVTFAGDPPKVQRDRFGIALGGVRLPQADAPVAANSAIPLAGDLAHLLRGSSRPFDAETLDALYGDEAAYRARFEEAARRAVDAGVLLARDVGPALEEAAREYRRVRGAQAAA
ncbi:MAG TPA: alpha/beta hydrolase domain-containing protein [Caulobacteraceae bacterium]|nr:alpha/beta hydrolase domain-containing protein [Caulobacteraceae bacterium]